MLFLYINSMILIFIHRPLHPLTMATVPDARIFMCLTVNNPGNQSHHMPPKYSHAIPRLLSFLYFYSKPSAHLIYQTAASLFCYDWLYTRYSTVSSASAPTLQITQKQ